MIRKIACEKFINDTISKTISIVDKKVKEFIDDNSIEKKISDNSRFKKLELLKENTEDKKRQLKKNKGIDMNSLGVFELKSIIKKEFEEVFYEDILPLIGQTETAQLAIFNFGKNLIDKNQLQEHSNEFCSFLEQYNEDLNYEFDIEITTFIEKHKELEFNGLPDKQRVYELKEDIQNLEKIFYESIIDPIRKKLLNNQIVQDSIELTACVKILDVLDDKLQNEKIENNNLPGLAFNGKAIGRNDISSAVYNFFMNNNLIEKINRESFDKVFSEKDGSKIAEKINFRGSQLLLKKLKNELTDYMKDSRNLTARFQYFFLLHGKKIVYLKSPGTSKLSSKDENYLADFKKLLQSLK